MSIVPRQLVWYEVNSYVHSQILKTLLEMMRVDNFNSITISRLTAKAEVGRASFYRNYQTKEDVLRQEAERLNNELNNIRRNDDPNDYRLKLLRTLDFYKANSDFYMTIYNAAASASAFSFRCSSFSSFLHSFSESFSSRLRRAASLATPPLALRQASFQDLICST